MGKRSGHTEDRELSRLSKRELAFELTVWKARLEVAANAYQRKSAESRVHSIQKAMAIAD